MSVQAEMVDSDEGLVIEGEIESTGVEDTENLDSGGGSEVEEKTEEVAEEEDVKPSEDPEALDDEVIITIGEESPPSNEVDKAPEWVKELRKSQRQTAKRNKELEAELKDLKEGGDTPQPLGDKPKLENFDYDATVYEAKLAEWYDRKILVDKEQSKLQDEKLKQDAAWRSQLDKYSELKSQLKVRDFEEAEAVVLESLNPTQQGIIVQGAENSAHVMYALGINPKKAKEFSLITDPVKFAFAVAKLETQLKVTNRKAPPAPEKKVSSGTGSKSGMVDSTLERLRADAEKTGDYSKVSRYKRQRQQAK